ncbi:MAG: DUF1569 domain-containing protein [Flavobacteriales bacterium]
MAFISLDKKVFEDHLSRLRPEDRPQWGSMGPQQMLEHLVRSLRISQGVEKQSLRIPVEKLEEMQNFLFSEKPMPREVKSATMVDEDAAYWYEDLEAAKKAFLEEWDRFCTRYDKDPEKREVHPVFGELDRKGWEQVHRKHFTHHLQQFGLLDEEVPGS